MTFLAQDLKEGSWKLEKGRKVTSLMTANICDLCLQHVKDVIAGCLQVAADNRPMTTKKYLPQLIRANETLSEGSGYKSKLD